MKKKILVLTLCFTLLFSSFNYKKSYAFDFVVTPSMFYTVSALTVAYGLSITDADALYNMSREFISFCGDTYSDVQQLFNKCVSYSNGIVNVGKEFLDKFNEFLTVNKPKYEITDVGYTISLDGLPVYFGYPKNYFWYDGFPALTRSFRDSYLDSDRGMFVINGKDVSSSYLRYDFYSFQGFYSADHCLHAVFYNTSNNVYYHEYLGLLTNHLGFSLNDINGGYKNPFVGAYDDSLVNGNLSNVGSLGLVLNPNVDSLIGKNPSDIIYDGTNAGVYDGSISIPQVDNPSIGVEGDLSFPTVGDVPDVDVPDVDVPDVDVPNDGIWSTIKDFIIGLVVPGDAFWTDTWGGLYNNFTNSFPMVDMDGFNDLVTGEKKFPNIDINIMGVNGRVVNGDVINSIVDWLRPIVAGFMMLCLMLFNYRKIYKLIRNSEPFGGIAPGTSDFSTGISEYSKQEVVKATDMVAEYRAWKERGGK